MNENQNGPGRGNEGGPNNNKNHSTLIIFLSVTLITLLVMSFFNNLMTKSTASEEIKYNEFLRLLDEDKVKSVKISSDKLTITPSSQPLSSGGVTIELYTGNGISVFPVRFRQPNPALGRLVFYGHFNGFQVFF